MVNLQTQMLYTQGEMFNITNIKDNIVYLKNYHDNNYIANIHFRDIKEVLNATENKNLRESFNEIYPEIFI